MGLDSIFKTIKQRKDVYKINGNQQNTSTCDQLQHGEVWKISIKKNPFWKSKKQKIILEQRFKRHYKAIETKFHYENFDFDF